MSWRNYNCVHVVSERSVFWRNQCCVLCTCRIVESGACSGGTSKFQTCTHSFNAVGSKLECFFVKLSQVWCKNMPQPLKRVVIIPPTGKKLITMQVSGSIALHLGKHCHRVTFN